jgi:hypothetical protein
MADLNAEGKFSRRGLGVQEKVEPPAWRRRNQRAACAGLIGRPAVRLDLLISTQGLARKGNSTDRRLRSGDGRQHRDIEQNAAPVAPSAASRAIERHYPFNSKSGLVIQPQHAYAGSKFGNHDAISALNSSPTDRVNAVCPGNFLGAWSDPETAVVRIRTESAGGDNRRCQACIRAGSNRARLHRRRYCEGNPLPGGPAI